MYILAAVLSQDLLGHALKAHLLCSKHVFGHQRGPYTSYGLKAPAFLAESRHRFAVSGPGVKNILICYTNKITCKR